VISSVQAISTWTVPPAQVGLKSANVVPRRHRSSSITSHKEQPAIYFPVKPSR